MLQRSLILTLLSLVFCTVQNLQAATFDIINATGGSYTETDSSGNVTLYGGLAGTCASPSTTTTCNTCTDTSTPPKACNPTAVNGTLNIGITVRIGTAVPAAGRKVRVYTETTTADRTPLGIDGTIPAAAVSSTVTIPVAFNWGNICQIDTNFSNTTCIKTPGLTNGTAFLASRKIVVGIDENGDGDIDSDDEVEMIPVKYHFVDSTVTAASQQSVCTSTDNSKLGACGFALDVGGDEKLFMRDVILSSSTPLIPADAPEWFGVAFFYQDQTGQALTPANVSTGTNPPIIKSYDKTDYSIDATLDGFTNYRDYCLIMGNINKSQNIFYLTTGGVPADNCGTPSEVVGLLDDKSCFISTAAFGSDMALEVETFRRFRNHFLIPYDFGREFIKAYYEYSPPAANFIGQSEVLRFIARVLLYPFYFFSILSLKFGFLFALLSVVMTLLFVRQLKFFMQIWKSFGLRNRMHLKVWILLFSLAFFVQNQTYAQIFPNEKKVQKPGAEADGLVKIDKDGVYIYKPELQNAKHSSHVRLGMVSNPDVESEICDENDQNCQAISFDDIYSGASGMGFEYLYEYFFFTDGGVNYGKLGGQLGISASYAQGQGRLVSDLNTESIESFTFLTVPLFAGAVYRFEYRDRQILVPYAGGGGVYTILAEKREDSSDIKGVGAPGFYAIGGALLNISALDRDLGSDFEAEYDIKNLWLSAEFKFISVSSEAFSLENGYIQGGMGFDF
ncbi:MAG: CFI-box-CTERM domain-containing protein [Bdellovibrionota bacterium]